METFPLSSSQWTLPGKISFRFLLIYFTLYIFPFPLYYLPWIGEFMMVDALWEPMVKGFAKSVLDLELTVMPNGSGDTTFNYVQILLSALIALVVTIIWSIIDRNRYGYDKWYEWLEIAIRYYLAFTLISYGCAKIFKTQFPSPGPMRLMQDIGDMSPMGLAWTFMGYSKGFNLFTGFGEAIGGFLLLFRRTKILGVFISLAVMSNIVVMNFCYDIPVKLYSCHLLIMILFVSWRDLSRISDFLIFNKPTTPANLTSPLAGTRFQLAGNVTKFLLIAFVLFEMISGGFENQKKWGDLAPKPPLYGAYDVQQFIINQDTLAPTLTDSVRWNTMAVQWPGNVAIKTMDNKMSYRGFEPDTIEQNVLLYNWRDSLNEHTTLNYQFPNQDTLLLNGIWLGDTLDILLKKRQEKDFRLINRGFHWINEYPYNR